LDDVAVNIRWSLTLEAAIGAGEVKHAKRFEQWALRVRKKPAPPDPLKPETKAGTIKQLSAR
jgi:hypothetical protein